MYFDSHFNNRHYQLPKIFPTPHHSNIVIGVTGAGSSKFFSTLVSKIIPDLEYISKSQNFPLYYYEKFDDALHVSTQVADEFGYVRRDAISDWSLEHFKNAFNETKISKEDIFYYIYGILHSATYRSQFQNDFKKMDFKKIDIDDNQVSNNGLGIFKFNSPKNNEISSISTTHGH